MVARGTTAVILATAPAAGGGPAAALAWNGETVLGRLLAQVSGLGVRHLQVITRQGWASALATSATGSASATVHESEHVAGDLRAVAAIARRARGLSLIHI